MKVNLRGGTMQKKLVKAIAVMLGTVLLGSTITGCTKKVEQSAPSSGQSTSGTVTYPIKTDVTLKYWMELHANSTAYAKNFAELPIAQDLMKKTGIKVEYIHPPTGQAKEAFNILVASGDLPDIIEYTWMDYPGGPTNAIANKVIIKLNEAIDKYSPNFKSYLSANPEINKQVKADDGTYYVYPFIRGSKELQNTSGPMVRKDWLDDLGLAIPDTLDDWDKMLRAFKDKKGATAALTAVAQKDGTQIINIFEGAFGFRSDFYHENGKINYGLIQPGYKAFLEKMAKWYEEGILDRNFSTTDRKAQDANILNGKSGATYGAGGGQMGQWLTTMKDKDPKFNLTSTKYPSPKKGEPVKFGFTSFEFTYNGMAAISANCKNVDIAARYLDYAYGKEGNMLINFGTEGVSYKMVNGKPVYTDLVMKNPDKLTVAQAMTKYARANTNGPFIQDLEYIMQYYELQQQKDALKSWSEHDKKSTFLPPISQTTEESAEIAKIMTDIDTYVQEMRLKFIMGKEPLSNWDKYVEQVKKMNIAKAIELRQKALDRYNKR